MAWLRVALTAAEQAIGRAEREAHSDPLVRRRLSCVWMLHCGATREAAAKYLDVALATVNRDVALFRAGGLAALRKSQRTCKPVSALDAHADAIRASLEQQPARSLAELGDRIAKLTDVARKPTQVRAFARRLGLKWRRVRKIPAPPRKSWPSMSPTRTPS